MAAFGAVELGEDPASVTLVVEVGEQVNSFCYASVFGQGAAKWCGAPAALEDTEEFRGFDGVLVVMEQD